MSVTRIAIVTGAASVGIGRAIAMRLADDGLDVAVNDLPHRRHELEGLAQEIISKGRRSLVVCGDTSRDADVKGLVAKVVDELGGLDVMVANVGIHEMSSLLEMNVDKWERMMRINVLSTMLCYKYAAEQLVKQGRGGRIVGASSLTGKKGLPNMLHYSASKFAVRGLTQSAAGELAPHKITVNAYAPGSIKTESWGGQLDTEEDRVTLMKDRMGINEDMKVGQPEDIAGLVSYLVRPEAHFITGQTISIDGGLHFD